MSATPSARSLRIVELRQAGHSYGRIAAETGESGGYIYFVLKRAGLVGGQPAPQCPGPAPEALAERPCASAYVVVKGKREVYRSQDVIDALRKCRGVPGAKLVREKG